jgi:hypothetical protein
LLPDGLGCEFTAFLPPTLRVVGPQSLIARADEVIE